jgi:hypothetical protein
MNKLEYQCCFCGEGIGDDTTKVHSFDPCAVLLIANWSKDEDKQKEQQFFCHFECFRKLTNSHAPIYIDDLESD